MLLIQLVSGSSPTDGFTFGSSLRVPYRKTLEDQQVALAQSAIDMLERYKIDLKDPLCAFLLDRINVSFC